VGTLNTSHLAHLEVVKILRDTIDNVADFGFLAGSSATLRELQMTWVVVGSPALLPSFAALETLDFRGSGDSYSNLVLPPNLKTFSSSYWPSGAFSLNSTTLQTLTLIRPSFDGFTPTSLPDSLRSLTIEGMTNAMTWPPRFPSQLESLTLKIPQSAAVNFVEGIFNPCTSFKSLVITDVTGVNWLPTFPTLHTTKLEKLFIERAVDSTFTRDCSLVICRAPPATLKHLSVSGSTLERLPDCVSNFNALETLNVTGLLDSVKAFPQVFENVTAPNLLDLIFDSRPFGGENPAWSNLIDQFPNLERIRFTSNPTLLSPFPLTSLMSLVNLRQLSLKGARLTGSLPSNWFTAHPRLVILDLSSNRLTGTIPSAGWASLQSVDLSNNLFTDFPYIEYPGAPVLESLIVSLNQLRSFPNDVVFEAMSKLRTLSLFGISSLGGPLPAFWVSSSSKLNVFLGHSCNFTGTVPSIRSPYIRTIRASGNSLCGSLPDMPRTVSASLDLGDNFFSGAIPASWAPHFTAMGTLLLQDNLLEGSFPQPLLATNSKYSINSINLSNNYFSGPLWNMSGYVGLSSFSITGPNMRLSACEVSVGLSSVVSSCTIPDQFGCECPANFAWCNRLTSCSTSAPELPPDSIAPFAPSTIVQPPQYECATPPPRQLPPPPPPSNPPVSPPAARPCPPPSPGAGFECNDGVWKATETVTQPNLEVPGGSVVVVEGNLTVTDGVVFNGIDSQVVVNGCIFLINNQVQIELTKEEIEQLTKEGKISKTLLASLAENDCLGASDLTNTKVFATKGAGSKGCRKLRASNEGSTRSSLQVVFQIDNTNCNLAIILPSVIGGLLLITAAIAVVGFKLHKRPKIRRDF
jgi:hypothetical protein